MSLKLHRRKAAEARRVNKFCRDKLLTSILHSDPTRYTTSIPMKELFVEVVIPTYRNKEATERHMEDGLRKLMSSVKKYTKICDVGKTTYGDKITHISILVATPP